MLRDGLRTTIDSTTSERQELSLFQLMNTIVKQWLQIPEHVVWSSSSSPVFNTLRGDFMKPVTESSMFKIFIIYY